MKKALLSFFAIVLILSLISCVHTMELDGEYNGYYLEVSRSIYGSEYDSISITNYKQGLPFSDYPEYQELVQYGCVGIENEGIVYAIYIVDTSIDPESEDAYYCAEFDCETRELLFEEGAYYSDSSYRETEVKRLLDMIDAVKDEYLR